MTQTIFKRKIYNKLLQWKHESKGRTALLIEGARRIGKSTIVEEFARNEYDDYLIIDFSQAEPQVVELFNHTADLERFFLGLNTLTPRPLRPGRSLVVFDEVQFCPKARQAIKHLVKDGRFDYVETGSLISIKKNVKDILIPSEEERINMHPMDFEEFLQAIGKGGQFDMARHCFERVEPLGDAMNRAVMADFRLYLLVGGMPQAVAEYLTSNNLAAVDRVKRSILALYDADFRKIDTLGRISTFFNEIPSQLSRNVMRYKVGSVIEGARPSRMSEIFANMADSRTVNFAFHADDPSAGFALHANYEFFKMFVADTGLFISLAFKDNETPDGELYRKILFDKLPVDLGYVYENAVAQQLVAAGHTLFYSTFRQQGADGTTPRNYEVDFLISRRGKVCPIEVKSSNPAAHRSLDEFQRKYSSRIATPYLLSTKDVRRQGEVVCLPVYMAGLL